MRHLFGPVDAQFANQNLSSLCASGDCLTFGHDSDLPLMPDALWSDVESRFPSEWKPDFIAVWLPYTQVPNWVWQAPIPVIGLAADWNLQWHRYRKLLDRCDVVLTDTVGVEVMQRAGFRQARTANLFGLERDFLGEVTEGQRDIDVVFVGNLSAPVQGERLPWLARIAQLSDRYSVVIASGVFGQEYRNLLRRSKIAFNRSIRGECNKRTLEGPACGCLLFQESDNREVRNWLKEGDEFIAYDSDFLSTLLEAYLQDDAKRRVIAEAGNRRVQDYGFESLWRRIIQELEGDWPGIQQHAENRSRNESFVPVAMPPTVAGCIQAKELTTAGRTNEAIAIARQALIDLERPSITLSLLNDVQPWIEYDLARVEWEKAASEHAGDPFAESLAKRNLLRWRLHVLLACLTDDLSHHCQAVLARADLFYSRAALGCALGRSGRLGEALPHLQKAVEANPFDLEAAQAYAQVLRNLQELDSLDEFCRSRRLLSQAALGIVPREKWFGGRDDGQGLASVIILCCNEGGVTRVCLDSIRRQTRRPYELILIDNGSTDGTPELLAEVKSWAEPARVEIIRNETNLGYPAGVNQGLHAARGNWIVLLNNDTAVTPYWLEDLIEVSMADGGPALVGPISNNAPAPQYLAASYTDLVDLDGFAQTRRQQFGGKFRDFERLTGFCLLIPRRALLRIGGLDERYGAGFFDDDDLCICARRSNIKLRVAVGVYIHHEGSRTFRSLGIDTSSLLDENFGKFKEKWGDEAAAPYRKPEQVRELKPGVSLTMIVKNEEQNLAECLKSVRDLVDEIVIADTGSSDRTKEIALSFGAEIVDFPWIDHFAAARNEAIKNAGRQWIFWMDADDRLNEPNREKLKALFAGLPESNSAFAMKCRCLGKDEQTMVDHVRLFRNDSRHRFSHRVHEQILPALRATQADVQFADVEILHVGYADPETLRRKGQRNLRLLLVEQQEQPDHPYTLFNLGSAYLEQGQYAEALGFLRRSIAASDSGDSIVRKLYVLVARCHWNLGQQKEALAACQDGRVHYPDDAELLFIEGQYRRDSGDPGGAEGRFRRLVDGEEVGFHFGSVNPALRAHIGRHLLASLLADQKRYAEAEGQWRVALTENPDYRLAWLGLADLYLKTANWSALEQVITHFGESLDGEVLRGRLHLAKKEFATARWILSQAMEQYPQELMPRVFLSHALLQEAQDWPAAEKALRSILEIDPGNREANNNLQVLLDQQRHSA